MLKEFLSTFPMFNPNIGAGLLPWLASLVNYCAQYGVYLPPLHTLTPKTIYGRWARRLPLRVQSQLDSAFSTLLLSAFRSKHTCLTSDDSLLAVVHGSQNGYYVFYNLVVHAQHPMLQTYPPGLIEPRQSKDMSIRQYLVHWVQHLFVRLLGGSHLSDRYFFQQFISNMDHSLRNTLGAWLEQDLLRKSRIGSPIPYSFHPDHLVTCLLELSRYHRAERYVTATPRDLVRPPGGAQIRQIAYDNSDVTELSFDLMVSQLQGANRRCFFCGDASCTLNTCVKAAAARDDPLARKFLHNYFRGQFGASSSSSHSRSRPAAVRALLDGSASSDSDSDPADPLVAQLALPIPPVDDADSSDFR